MSIPVELFEFRPWWFFAVDLGPLRSAWVSRYVYLHIPQHHTLSVTPRITPRTPTRTRHDLLAPSERSGGVHVKVVGQARAKQMPASPSVRGSLARNEAWGLLVAGEVWVGHPVGQLAWCSVEMNRVNVASTILGGLGNDRSWTNFFVGVGVAPLSTFIYLTHRIKFPPP